MLIHVTKIYRHKNPTHFLSQLSLNRDLSQLTNHLESKPHIVNAKVQYFQYNSNK